VGTPVFLHYDRPALDAQYDNRAKIPSFPAHLERWAADSERARRTLGARVDVRYGDSPRQSLNVYAARGATPAPVLVWIHGGYWRAQAKEDNDFVAAGFVPRGVAVVNVEYELMPGVRMDDVVRQCRAATAWAMTNAASFGGDPSRVWIAGHSAGGHLTAAIAATDWDLQPGIPGDARPAGGFSISGLHDLEPIRLCFLNDTLAMDEDEARRNSPLRMAAPRDGDWTLMVGGLEGPEYLRQAVGLAAAWGSNDTRRVRAEVIDGADHLSIVAPLGDPGSAAVERIARAMGAAAG
jgi:arylformamidase